MYGRNVIQSLIRLMLVWEGLKWATFFVDKHEADDEQNQILI